MIRRHPIVTVIVAFFVLFFISALIFNLLLTGASK